MKEILLVVATYPESLLVREALFGATEVSPLMQTRKFGIKISLLHTGLGMVNTALQLGRHLGSQQPDLMINFGIAGSYRLEFPLGKVVEIREEIYGDMGANSPRGFLDLEEMGFAIMEKKGQPVYNALHSPYMRVLSLPACRGITVNEVSGIASQIAFRKFKWEGDVETMEGAAFFQAGLYFDVPFFAIRGISNYVEPRNKENWEIGLAVKNVQVKLLEILEKGADLFIGKFRENP